MCLRPPTASQGLPGTAADARQLHDLLVVTEAPVFTSRHLRSASGLPAPRRRPHDLLARLDVERDPRALAVERELGADGILGRRGGGAKRFLKADLRLPTMFMYMKGDAGT